VRLPEAGCDSGQGFTQIQVEEASVRVTGVFDSENTAIEWTRKQLQVDRLVEVKAEADGWQAESVRGGRGLREGNERVEAEGVLISVVDEGAEARLVSVVGQEAGGEGGEEEERLAGDVAGGEVKGVAEEMDLSAGFVQVEVVDECVDVEGGELGKEPVHVEVDGGL